MGFLFETGLIGEDEFREGNIPARVNAVSFLKKCFSVLPAGKSINYLRSDGAFYQAGVVVSRAHQLIELSCFHSFCIFV